MQVMKSIKKALSRKERALRRYIRLQEREKLKKSYILLESQQGRSHHGNLYYILKALLKNEEFESYSIFFVVEREQYSHVKKFFNKKGMDRVSLVIIDSDEYVRLLATAKYIFTDTALPPYYIKKEGQVVWNMWHGTPLKAMGRRDKKGLHDLGNIQRNFIFADYLTFPNAYTAQHMIEDYMLSNLSRAKYFYAGFPRNEAFFDFNFARQVRNEIATNKRKVYAYLPTWRLADNEELGQPNQTISEILAQIDLKLNDDELLLVSLHPMESALVDFSNLKNIREFPSAYEKYEVLNICDVLVTDYSSVMFDFAITQKKIVLFDYDREKYMESRGAYIDMRELPFPKEQTIDGLISEMRRPKSYDDSKFLKSFCCFDRKTISHDLCEAILTENFSKFKLNNIPSNGKKNVLIYAGNLAKNGITTALFDLLNAVEVDKVNYFVTFSTKKVSKNKEKLNELPEGVSYIPMKGKSNQSIKEKIVQYLYGKGIVDFNTFDRVLNKVYKTENLRLFGSIDFDTVIQFSGYEFRRLYMFSLFPCHKVVYVHNDMRREIELKGNQHENMLRYAYRAYDKVAVVSEDIMNSTMKIAGDNANLILVCNVFDYRKVRTLASAPVEFHDETLCDLSLDELKSFIEKSNQLLLSIGRFSPEKQHKLLLDAFDDVWKSYPDSTLIIIGGGTHTDLFEETYEYLQSLSCKKAVVLIKQMRNPYPILNAAKGFILPSMYEGFGLVLLEATALNKPTVATDVSGPRNLMTEYKGTLVDNSLEGVKKGIMSLLCNDANTIQIDFEEYNKRAVSQFYSLLD